MINKIYFSDEDILKCKKFAKEVVNETYDRFKKNIFERTERIFFGKLGEVAFLNLLISNGVNPDTSGMFEIYKGVTNVDSFDFLTKNKEKIDIKTAYKKFHAKILIPEDQFEKIPKEFYVGVKIDLDNKKAEIWGYCTHGKLEQNGKKDFGEGLAYWEDLKNLKDIKEIINLIV